MFLFYGFLGYVTQTMEDITNKPMITANELSKYLGIGYIKALQVINDVYHDMEKNGCYVIKTRPIKVPTQIVLEKLSIK